MPLAPIFKSDRFEVLIEAWSRAKQQRLGADYSYNEPHFLRLDGLLVARIFADQGAVLAYLRHVQPLL